MVNQAMIDYAESPIGYCGWVVDYDDSIGGEGEIMCHNALKVTGENAVCKGVDHHEWQRCYCGERTCKGWRFRH